MTAGRSTSTSACCSAPDGEPVWFGRGQDANGARRTVFMADEHIIGYPDHYVQSTERHPMDYLAGIIDRARGWGRRADRRRDGQLLFQRRLPCRAAAPPARRRASSTPPALVNWQRAVKSRRELDYMRRAARIVEAMHARILELVEPGMPQERAGRRDLPHRHPRRRRPRRRLPGDRAAAAVGHRRLGRRT